MRGGRSVAKKDVEGLITLLVDAEMTMFRGLPTPVIWLQNVVVDLLLGLGLPRRLRDLRRPRADALRGRARIHHDEPAAAARRARGRRAREPDRLREHQQDRLPDVGRDRRLPPRDRHPPGSARSRCRCSPPGAIPPREALEWVCEQPNIESIVFGASSRANIRATRELLIMWINGCCRPATEAMQRWSPGRSRDATAFGVVSPILAR